MLPKKPSNIDATKIDFKADAVAPGTTAAILVRTLKLFRGQKLVVEHGAKAFLLTSIEIDGVEWLPKPKLNWADRLVLWWHKVKRDENYYGIHCVCFEPTAALGNGLQMRTASKTLQLRVYNESAAPADFRAGLYGQVLR